LRPEADVSVNAHHRAAGRTRVGDEIWAELLQAVTDVNDEPQDGIAYANLVAIFVALEPVPIIVPLEVPEKLEQVSCESNPSLPPASSRLHLES